MVAQDADRPSYPGVISLRKNMTFIAPGVKRELIIEDLTPYSVYNVSVVAENQHGKSLPSYYLLVLTLSRNEARLIKAKRRQEARDQQEEVSFTTPSPPPPKLPDVRACCSNLPNISIHTA